MKSLGRLFGFPIRILKRGAAIDRSLADIARRLERLERLSMGVRTDVEILRRRSAVMLDPRRAVALMANGRQIFVDPQDRGVALSLLTDGQIEVPESKVLRRLLKPGTIMLDVGANYGYYSLLAAPHVRPGGKVIGFEPNPLVLEFFRKSVTLNDFDDVVEVHGQGLSDSEAVLPFEVDPSCPGGGRILGAEEPPRPGHDRLDVPVVRLDDHLPSGLVVDIVKLDVEGHEAQVLSGMRAVIARSPGIVIVMEFIFAFFRDEDEVRELLRMAQDELGLKVQRIVGDATVVAADFSSLRDTACTLILSRHGIPPMPALTFHPAQFSHGAGASLVEGALVWDRPAGRTGLAAVACGPYLHLPRGIYRIKADADWDGDFVCRLQDNFGDCLLERSLAELSRSAILELAGDARFLEMAVIAGEGAAHIALRGVEFWPA